jgi:hypothetical protein
MLMQLDPILYLLAMMNLEVVKDQKNFAFSVFDEMRKSMNSASNGLLKTMQLTDALMNELLGGLSNHRRLALGCKTATIVRLRLYCTFITPENLS